MMSDRAAALFLALLATGAALSCAGESSQLEIEREAALAALLRDYSTDQMAGNVPASYSETTYFSAWSDLDGDGFPDAVVLLEGPSWCGTGGCRLLVIRGGEASLEVISGTPAVWAPVQALNERRNGWRNLSITTYVGGSPSDRELTFDGTTYQGASAIEDQQLPHDSSELLIPESANGRQGAPLLP